MVWISQQEGELLVRFLEPCPPLNNHSNLLTSYICFYSSEMKNLGQILDTLTKISTGGWQELEVTARTRYRNTLINLGLITEDADNPVITTYGMNLVNHAVENSLTSEQFRIDDENSPHAFSYEKIILRNLLSILVNEGEEFAKAKEYAAEKVFNMQEFVNSIPENNLLAAVNDLEMMLFLQLINSSKYEVRRFFALSEAEQDEAYSIWQRLIEERNFPTDIPAEFLKKMAFLYARPLAKKAIQRDIRFRVQTSIKGFIELKSSMREMFPVINANLTIRRIDTMTRANTNNYTLENPATRTPVNQPNQLIICGCPGSGKSQFIRSLLPNDPNTNTKVITFHPDFGYSDLIGTYKPTPLYEPHEGIKKASGEIFHLGIPRINYEFIPGPLIDRYLYAVKNPNVNVFLIIEEVNRANCNTIFGDFFQLLDRNERGESQYTITAMPDLADFLQGHSIDAEIRLPPNLFIWCSMNSADQGVFPLDSAFRRRWEFLYKGYKTPCAYDPAEAKIKYNSIDHSWETFRAKINTKLTMLDVHEDKLIGPYFLSLNELKDSEKVLNKLFLYLWEDVLRFQRRELMDFYSFADLAVAWNSGIGSPLNINLSE